MTLGSALFIVGGSLATTAVIMVLLSRSVSARMPVGILRRLRASGTSYTVKASLTRGVWNPGGSAGNYRIIGPGTATYHLEQTDDGEVLHLVFTDERGHTRHESGPVTDRLRQITGPRGRTRFRYSALTMGLGQVTFFAAGVALGLLLTSGRPQQDRVIGVFVGVGVAMLVLYLGLFVTMLILGLRKKPTSTTTTTTTTTKG